MKDVVVRAAAGGKMEMNSQDCWDHVFVADFRHKEAREVEKRDEYWQWRIAANRHPPAADGVIMEGLSPPSHLPCVYRPFRLVAHGVVAHDAQSPSARIELYN